MTYIPKIRRHGQHTIPNNLLNGVDTRSIEALDELIKAGPAGILSIALRDNLELGGPAAPYILKLRKAGFRIYTVPVSKNYYKGTILVCGRYILETIPHKSMMPAIEQENQPKTVAAGVAIAPVAGNQLALDLFPNAANEHTGPDLTGGMAI